MASLRFTLVLILVTMPCCVVHGQGRVLLFDDFEDGDAEDGNPARWEIGLAGGTRSVSDGSYILDHGGSLASITALVEMRHSDVSIRSRVRILERRSPTDAAIIWGRDSHGVPGGYWGGIQTDGQLVVGVFDAIRRAVDSPLDPVGGDVFLQLDLLGDMISLTAWGDQLPKPNEPQLTLNDGRFAEEDLLGVAFVNLPDPRGEHSPVAFRDFEVLSLDLDAAQPLLAGDADQDLDFDQLDLVQVQVAAKYLTGQSTTWGEGDWNSAPGGRVGNPPAGDGVFNQLDIVAAQQAGIYLTGPYATIRPNGRASDGQTSVVYDAGTGEIAVDVPAGTELTSINIDSAARIFTGSSAHNLGGSFDNDADNNIFKATFGGSFGSLSFGIVAPPGLAEDFLLGDLTVIGSLARGGELGDVDLIYVSEPASIVLLALACLTVAIRIRKPIRG